MTDRAPIASRSSISDVAARAGVSIATVSRVLNGVKSKASPATAARVWQAAEALGYRPGSVGRALRQQKSRIVAVLAANLANPAMAAIAASAETALREAGLVMVLCDTHDRADLQDEYLLEMRAQLACAIVLLGAVESPQLAAAQAAGEVIVWVNREGPKAGLPFVGIDNISAGAEVAELFEARGLSQGAVLHASVRSSATEGRVVGFATAVGPGAVIASHGGADHLLIGYHGIEKALAPGRDAGVFCTSDLIAYGAHRRLGEIGLRVPEDVLLVGFDDNPLNDWLAPWLCSVRVPYAAFGPAILEVLQAAQSGVALRRVLPHQLIIR